MFAERETALIISTEGKPAISVSPVTIFLVKVLTRNSLKITGFHFKIKGNKLCAIIKLTLFFIASEKIFFLDEN